MNNYDVLIRLQSLEKTQAMLVSKLEKLLAEKNSEKDLLDNSDMMRKFNMSERTLAYMRSRHEIDYIKINGKIYYPKEAVDRMMRSKYVSKTSALEIEYTVTKANLNTKI
jgi:hypothetical protein